VPRLGDERALRESGTRHHEINDLAGIRRLRLNEPDATQHNSSLACSATAMLRTFRVGLRRARLKLQRYKLFVTYYPSVMSWLDHKRVAWADLALRPVLVTHVQPSGLNNTHVTHLTTVGSSNRFDAFRPFPPWLKAKSASRRSAHLHNVDLRLVWRPRLVGSVKVTRFHSGHAVLLRVAHDFPSCMVARYGHAPQGQLARTPGDSVELNISASCFDRTTSNP